MIKILNKEHPLGKLEDLKKAIELLEGQDLDALKQALTLIGEPVSEVMSVTGGTYSGGSLVKIVMLQRGWVYIGKFSQAGNKCTLTDASSVRYWGTTKGLGELANDGPTDKTKLDKAGMVTFHELTVVGIIDCVDSVWNSKL